jgi:hypothetical protein
MRYLKINASRPGKYPEDGHDPMLYNAPGLFLFTARKDSVCGKDDCDIAAVNVNMLFRAHRMGSCYIGGIVHGYMLNHRPLKKVIGLPKNMTVYQAMIFGYPKYGLTSLPWRKEAVISTSAI